MSMEDSCLQIGLWKESDWRPAWGVDAVEHFLACLGNKLSPECQKPLVAKVADGPHLRHTWKEVPQHLVAFEAYRERIIMGAQS